MTETCVICLLPLLHAVLETLSARRRDVTRTSEPRGLRIVALHNTAEAANLLLLLVQGSLTDLEISVNHGFLVLTSRIITYLVYPRQPSELETPK